MRLPQACPGLSSSESFDGAYGVSAAAAMRFPIPHHSSTQACDHRLSFPALRRLGTVVVASCPCHAHPELTLLEQLPCGVQVSVWLLAGSSIADAWARSRGRSVVGRNHRLGGFAISCASNGLLDGCPDGRDVMRVPGSTGRYVKHVKTSWTELDLVGR